MNQTGLACLCNIHTDQIALEVLFEYITGYISVVSVVTVSLLDLLVVPQLRCHYMEISSAPSVKCVYNL